MRYGVYGQYKDGSKNGYYVEGPEMTDNESNKQWMENRAYEWSTIWPFMHYEVRQNCFAEPQEVK